MSEQAAARRLGQVRADPYLDLVLSDALHPGLEPPALLAADPAAWVDGLGTLIADFCGQLAQAARDEEKRDDYEQWRSKVLWMKRRVEGRSPYARRLRKAHHEQAERSRYGVLRAAVLDHRAAVEASGVEPEAADRILWKVLELTDGASP